MRLYGDLEASFLELDGQTILVIALGGAAAAKLRGSLHSIPTLHSTENPPGLARPNPGKEQISP